MERPITVGLGMNVLGGQDMNRLIAEVDLILAGKAKSGKIPPPWDSKAGERRAEIVERISAWHYSDTS